MTSPIPAAVERIGVVGCGLMGSGIAEVCARTGSSVVVVDQSPSALAVGRDRMKKSLERAVETGRLTPAERDRILGSVVFTTEWAELADRQLVVEAVVEDEAVKMDVFRRLDEVVVDPAAVLASNTSSIPIIKLAVVTKRPGSVVGLHFFLPVPVMKLVELVTTLLTEPETVAVAEALSAQLDKKVIRSRDRAGFVVNALLVPYLLSAIRMLESGFASREDIDAGMVEGCAHPMGPLALVDLVGLDTVAAVADSLYQEFKEPLFAAPALLSRMVQAGQLGRKTGQGFFEYARSARTEPAAPAPVPV